MHTTKTASLTLALLLPLALVACDPPKKDTPPPAATTEAPKPPPAAEAPAPAPLPPATYTIDVAHTRVGFSVKHMMVSTTRGQFGKFGGTVFLDEANPGASKVDLEIDADSIDTNEPKRDAHLRSADFFDVKQHPKLTFRSTKVEKAGAGYKVSGDLTIRGVTKPVVLEVDALTPVVKDPWGGTRRGTNARAVIDRKAWGLTWNKALEAGGVTVGDEVKLELDVELVEKKPS